MGKKGGSSWLTAVKRAFRSPTKESHDKVRNCRRKEDHHDTPLSEDQDDEKKKEKRRWLFKKATNQQESPSTTAVQHSPHVKSSNGSSGVGGPVVSAATGSDVSEQRHAIAVAVATAAAADAAVATAHAAMEAARLTNSLPTNANYLGEHSAAVLIQTAFRGYLARRALRALKGLVKLQALVRGHNVRKQAKMTLKCMQALVRVQARVLDQRLRLSHEGSRKSTFSDTTSVVESRYLQDIAERRSLSHSREPSSLADDWDERPHTIEEVKAMLQSRKDAVLRREKNLSQAFSQQMWRSDRSSVEEEELEEKPRWLDRWMASKQWDSSIAPSPAVRARASTDHRDSIKTVEIDTAQPYSYLAPNFRRSVTSTSASHYHAQHHNQRPSSPRAHHNQSQSQHHYHQHQHPPSTTPSPSRARPIQVRSASPRCIREERNYSSQVSQTPSLRSNYFYNGNVQPNHKGAATSATTSTSSGGPKPNYMAATESAKARLRSQSAPRHRPSTPERDRPGTGSGVKKRLSFPNPDPYSGMGYGNYNLRSPSFKSVNGVQLGMMEQQSIYSSCCTDSLGGEISPSSTSDLR
uniref:DUF4005 domain-containing protein n=2 Tax=Chenopodium quinoa TaxID=63459 RepID=A0A803M369_CHEQI